ncbi:MAG TPA: Ig-like domain-containing protein [Clostridia bacterium]|nr:Ig-like domain-containing protein [Clostridia bacterium]
MLHSISTIRGRRDGCFLLILLLFEIAITALAAAQTTEQDFTVALIPDPQNYSQFYPAIFKQQTRWIVNNAQARNIRFVIGEGDMVNNPGSPTEWDNAEAAVNVLDGKVPYAMAIGNHDYEGVEPAKRSAIAFNQHFGPSRYQGYSWYGGNYNGSNENFYTFLTVGTQRYMVLALEYYPRDAILTWASSVIDANPDAKIMLVTHSFLYTDGTRGDKCDTHDMSGTTGNNAQSSWLKFLSQKRNAMLAVSGHLVATSSAHRTDLGVNGNVVNQIFTNFQNWPSGGQGYLRLLAFHPSQNRVDVTTYSPYLNSWLTTSAYQFSLPLTNDSNTQITGAIEGKVRTSSCTAVAGATVTAGTTTATSDASGRFRLQSLLPDSNDVTVTASGYVSQTRSGVKVNAGYSQQTDFYPVPSTSAPCPLSTTDPSVTICTPANNATVTSPVRVVAGTTSSKGVDYVQVYVDGVKQYTAYSPMLDTNITMASGTRKLTVQAKDDAGVIFKRTIYVNAGSSTTTCTASTASSVNICTPANNAAISNPVHIAAAARSTNSISYLQVYVDGVKKYQVYASSLDTNLSMAVGTRRVTVQAKDSSGLTFKQTIYVTIK